MPGARRGSSATTPSTPPAATGFGGLVVPAREGALDAWAATPEGALALVLLLDQFPRNLFRGTAEAFASDAHARRIAAGAVLRDRFDLALTPTQRGFLYLPFEHSEDAADQDLSVALFEGLRDVKLHAEPEGTIDYAWRHWHVIRRFGPLPAPQRGTRARLDRGRGGLAGGGRRLLSRRAGVFRLAPP
jgi:uncharacterized protein (DUF924 family)